MSGVIFSSAGLSCAGLRGRHRGGGDSATEASAPPGESKPPAVVASAALGSLTVRKWRLDNGLEIITLPDPGSRSVTYLTLFRVGSRDEDAAAGETGLAHLFEHLMFTGTPAASGGGDFDQQIEEVGGSSNATTHYDFTSYIDELPPEALERAVRLEADRMMNLRLSDRQVANEREVVIQERLGSVEDSVDGTMDEMVWGQAFRAHPYRWPVIGRLSDIKAMTRARAAAFYRRHYTPDRALIVLTGRFDEAHALRLISAAYGPLQRPRGEKYQETAIVPERAPSAEVRTQIARPLPADRLVVGYPAPALGDKDRPAFDVLNALWVGGPSSRLYRQLVVERELASSVTGEVAPTRDPGLWCLWVQMTKGNSAARAEEVIQKEVERLIAEPVPAEELGAIKNRLETELWHDLSSSAGRAEALGQFEVGTGDFRNLIARAAAYRLVTAADVARVATSFLAPGARSIVVAVPGDR